MVEGGGMIKVVTESARKHVFDYKLNLA